MPTDNIISLPKGGGAVSGLGETFTADLFTGTAALTVPIALPAGRAGATPELALTYNSGNGNGPFGLGWRLDLPGVSRRTSLGVPRYVDTGERPDVFVLDGAEDLVPVGDGRYRPRTEGSFARIAHTRDASGDYWEVRARNGSLTRYGTPRPEGADAAWRDPAAVVDPADPRRVFGWWVTRTSDAVGNLIRYEYLRDQDQPLIHRVSYVDHGDPAAPSFLVDVDFEYERRPDAFSDHRAGFEIRTGLRCRAIRVTTHAADGVARVSREMRIGYAQAPFNGVSLLTRIDVVGIDGDTEEALPPQTFAYSEFDPAGRRFEAVTGPGLPAAVLSDPTLALVDLRGAGLPDVVELGAQARVWHNAGGGRFEAARRLAEAPPYGLADPGVRLLDADGDGRTDLLVSTAASGRAAAGYFPTTFAGGWDRRSFRPYRRAPSVVLADPSVRLLDLDGDGLTDVLRSGTRLESWFNDADPRRAWERGARTEATGPLADLSDPRVRVADMTGDGLQDIVLLRNGNVTYRPNLGHGRWGAPVVMRRSPRLPDGFDPRRVLLGDLDGDGAADLVYVDHGRILLWGNESGNGWSAEPIVLTGTPNVVDTDAVLLSDLHGTGMAGLLFSRAADGSGRHLRYLDVTGGVKPYLLRAVDNNMGAVTRIAYGTSTQEYLRDRRSPATRWRTTLPFPVHVVSRVEVDDAISGGHLTTEYRYHHGYWDGVEREFRGFAMVEKFDTETFSASENHSPPTLTRSWFHPGPVAALTADEWTELDLRHEYSPLDPPMLRRTPAQESLLAGLPRSARRDALRALRGQPLRTEMYALDGTARASRPYTVTETVVAVRPEAGAAVFFPFTVAGRTTQWERGDDPMHRFTFSAGHDEYGLPVGQLAIAVPRGRDPLSTVDSGDTTEPYLATYETTGYARRDDPDRYIVDRVAQVTGREVVNDGRLSVFDLRDAVLAGAPDGSGVSFRVIADGRTYFDGEEFTGLPLGTLGDHGLPVRTEALAFTTAFLDELFDGTPPGYLVPAGALPAEYPPEFRASLPALAGYRYDAGAYYVVTTQHRYDTHVEGRVPRGLVVASRDPAGAESRIEYDAHDLLPVRTIDVLGLSTTAEIDNRILRPRVTTDVNGNTASVTFSPLGFVTATFIRGRDGQGDATAPSVRMEYDLHAFAQRGQPVRVRSNRRVHHDTATDVPAEVRDEVISSVEYSDGFGRLLQTRTQAEDPQSVVVSGWQVYDNKGRIVQKYEPFFSTGFDYAPPEREQLGRKAVMFYDPRGQVTRTLSPDGSEQRVILGVPADLADPESFAPTPWESYTYDANDNAGRTHGAAAQPYADHWNTPASITVDALGRAVEMVARNGAEHIVTRSTFDILGNPLSMTDPLGRPAFRYRSDLLKRVWRTDGIDAGRRDTIPDGLGRVVEIRDAKGALTLFGFDIAHRPIRLWARDDASTAVTLRQRVEYGDGGDPNQPAAEREAARAHNLLSRSVRHYDEAGLAAVTEVDFKGNVLESTRRVIADAPILAAYARAATQGWRVDPFRTDWNPGAGQTRAQREAELLEPVMYSTSTRYDALNRVTLQILPIDVEAGRREVRPSYNRAGGLARVLLDGTVFVDRIAYDAKGQRTLITYGNGVTTRYAYDPDTLRLAGIRTDRQRDVLQDYGYRYDLAGNLLTILDRTPGCGLPFTPDALDRQFTYDPVYRLLSATGRESNDPPQSQPWTVVPRNADATTTRPYIETYTYDANNGMTKLAHKSAAGFARDFTIDAASNRLRRMRIGNTPFEYAYDACGNMVSETASRHYTWNHADRLHTFATQTPGAEPSVHAHYLYDATGQRVKKLVRRQGGAVDVTHYVGGFEHHRWGTGLAAQNNHVHVMDDQARIAIVRVGPASPGDQGPAVAFHLADHLGSSTVTVDGDGQVTNREEYTPYGETSFGGYTRKRYRFTGRERDEESGLNLHGARYCLAWLARWASCDPIGAEGGINQYTYAACNPLKYDDPAGTEPRTPAEDKKIAAIANFLQELADEFLEPALRRGPGETASPFGTRMHDVLQGIVESAEFNAPKDVPARRIVTEVIMTSDGRIHSFGGKPGGAPDGAVTVDIGILKQGYTNEDKLVGMKASDVLEAGIDYKTGDAKLAQRQRQFFDKIKTPLYKLNAFGNLESDMRGPTRARLRTSRGGWLGLAGAMVEIGLSVSMDMAAKDDPSTADVLASIGIAAASRRVPALGLVTARNHEETVIPIICVFAWKVCAVAAIGGGIVWFVADTAEKVEKFPEAAAHAGRARRAYRPF